MPATEKIRDVEAFAAQWCVDKGIHRNHELFEELRQEAWLAAAAHDYDRLAIVRAMDRFRKREYRTTRPLSSVASAKYDEGIDADDYGIDEDGFSRDGRCEPDELGLHDDSYHGWCRDDV